MGRFLHRAATAAALLLALAPSSSPASAGDPAPVPGARWSASGYEDRVLGIRIDRPPAPWTPKDWNGDWAGPLQAAVALVDPTGAVLSVHAKDAAGLSLEECVLDIAFTLRVSAPRPADLQEVQISGERALAFSATGDAQDDRRPYHAFVAVTVKDGVAYALAAFADGKDRPPGLWKILAERFLLLETGDFRRAKPPVDVEGAGWRTRGGTAEHALVGVRLPLGPGWRLAEDPRVPTSVALPSLNFDSPFLGAGIRLQAVPLEGRTWEEVEKAASEDFGRRFAPLKKSSGIAYSVGGSAVDFTWRLARRQEGETGDLKRYVLCGTLRGDGRLIMVEVRHPTAKDPRVPVAIRGALERLRVLGTEERADLVTALASRVDAQAFVGTGEVVRKGAYTSYAHRITWRKPSPLWSLLPHEMMSDPEGVLAVLQNEENGTNARLMVFDTTGPDTKWTLHQRVVDVFSDLWPGTRASKPVPTSLGSRDSIRTDMKTKFAGLNLRVTLITTNPVARKVYALVVVARDDADSAATLDEAVRGLRFQVAEIAGPRRTVRGWEDPGYGLRIVVPTGLVRADSRPVQFTPRGGTVVEVGCGGDRLVVAAREWPLGEPELETAATARVLSLLDPEGAAAGRFRGARDVPGMLAGLPSRDQVFPGSPAIRLCRLHTAGTLYVVGAAPAAEGGEDAVLSWFSIAD